MREIKAYTTKYRLRQQIPETDTILVSWNLSCSNHQSIEINQQTISVETKQKEDLNVQIVQD